ncbi:MAG TPA: class I SAM-dependent methyltransferase [Polyangiaceae bacterium]
MSAAHERRLVFGTVADLYDGARPTYPPALAEDVIAFAGVKPPERILEVGTGTGKATVLFAARGFGVLGIEPSAEMAAVARENCARYPSIRIEETDFECWPEEPGAFGLLFSAQAWHWVSPEVGYSKARSVLREGGALAVFWNHPAWEECELRDELAGAYRRAGYAPSSEDPMYPAGEAVGVLSDRDRAMAAAAGFAQERLRAYRWSLGYTTAEYLRLMGTHSAYLVLEEESRRALFVEVAAVIDGRGGRITLPLLTQLYLARAGG